MTDRLAADDEAAEAEEADDAADEAADEAAEAELTVVAAAEEVPLRVADPEPVVVMAPVVAMPEVEALALRQALEDPGWILYQRCGRHEKKGDTYGERRVSNGDTGRVSDQEGDRGSCQVSDQSMLPSHG